jgi:hypothetical protein
MVVRVATGEADPLSGLLLGVWDDLAELHEQGGQLRAQQRRALRIL